MFHLYVYIYIYISLFISSLHMFAVLKMYLSKSVVGKKRRQLFAYLIHIHLFEATLKNFEILYVFVLQIGLEFDPFQRYAAWKEHVHELTVNRSGAQLFDFGKRGLETVVNPC